MPKLQKKKHERRHPGWLGFSADGKGVAQPLTQGVDGAVQSLGGGLDYGVGALGDGLHEVRALEKWKSGYRRRFSCVFGHGDECQQKGFQFYPRGCCETQSPNIITLKKWRTISLRWWAPSNRKFNRWQWGVEYQTISGNVTWVKRQRFPCPRTKCGTKCVCVSITGLERLCNAK